MLTGIHILMTYKCNLACDHCFLYSSPSAKGTMTLPQIRCVLDESRKIGSVEWIYFEGGEPFLFCGYAFKPSDKKYAVIN